MTSTAAKARVLAREVSSLSTDRDYWKARAQKAEFQLARATLDYNEGRVEVLFVGGPRDGARQVFPDYPGPRYEVPGSWRPEPGPESMTIRRGSYRLDRCTYDGAPPKSYLGWWEGWK